MTQAEQMNGQAMVPVTEDEKDDAQALKNLRVPFPPEVIGKLPKATRKNVPDSEKKTCQECGAWMGPHIHLDYVGHSPVTDRLLTNDAHWQWEPFATDLEGLPMYRDAPNGAEVELWIRLTVRGVTRIGVGVVEKGKTDLGKQLISDALKNAAMRFGVALDLWTKDEIESQMTGEATSRTRRAPKSSTSTRGTQTGIPQDPETAGGVGFDSRGRNKIIAKFAAMDPPVRGQAEVASKIAALLNLDAPLAAAKLSQEQGVELAGLLGVEL